MEPGHRGAQEHLVAALRRSLREAGEGHRRVADPGGITVAEQGGPDHHETGGGAHPVKRGVESGDQERLPEDPLGLRPLAVPVEPGGEGLVILPAAGALGGEQRAGHLESRAEAEGAEAQEGEGQVQRRGQAEGAEPGAAGAGEHQHVEALLDAEVAPHPQLLDELQEARVAAEDRVLAAVHLDVAELEGGGLAAEQAAALHQGHPPALALQGERGGEAGEPRSDDRDVPDGGGTPIARGPAVRARLLDHGAHRARPAVVEEAHERSITPAFSPEESRTRWRSGSSGSASMRSRMPL